MSSSGKSGGAQRGQDYFGTIAGIACCGPIDFLSGVVVDNALVWPVAPVWPASRSYVHSKRVGSDGIHVGVQTGQPHGLAPGDAFTTWNFDGADPRLNLQLGVVASTPDAFGFTFAAPAGVGAFAAADFTDGFVSRAQPFQPGDLTRVGPTVYQCTAAHTATLASIPGSAAGRAFWAPFRLALGPAPALETEPGARDGSSPLPVAQLTAESHGEIFVYRGDPGQTLDTTREKVLTQYGHPAYRDQVVVVLKDFFFGRENVAAPSVAIVAGRTPVQTVITGPSAALDPDGQANPLCVLAELLTHPLWGLGLDPSVLDAASWQSAADGLCGVGGANQALFYLSPLIDEPRDVRQLAAELLDHADCWLRWNAAGVIEAGRRLRDQAPPPMTPGVNVVGADATVDGSDVGWESGLWDDTWNKVTLHYADRDHAWRTRPAIASAQWNREATGRIQEQIVEAPHVTRAAQALALAAWRVKAAAEPGATARLEVRAEAITARPGDLIWVAGAAAGAALPMMVTERTWKAPPAGRVEIQAESVRGRSPQPFRPAPGVFLGAPAAAPGPVMDNYIDADGAPNRPATPNYALVQLPPAAWGGRDFELTLLAGRTGAATRACEAWYRFLDAGAFKRLLRIDRFAVAGWVAAPWAPFADAAGNPAAEDDAHPLAFRVNPFTPQADLDHISAPPTADEAADNDLLIFVVANGDPHRLEVCSVKELAATGGGGYAVKVVRGVYGARQGGDGVASWTGGVSGGDLVFVLHRTEAAAATTDSAPGQARAGATITVRIAPESPGHPADPGDLYDPASNPGGLARETTYTWADPFAPAVDGWGLAVNGAPWAPGAPVGPADLLVLTVRVRSAAASLASVQVDATGGASPVQVLATAAVRDKPVVTLTSPAFSLGTGDWRWLATVVDRTGRAASVSWRVGATDVLVHVPPAGAAPNPPAANPAGGYFTSGDWPVATVLTCSTPGAECQFQVAPLGAPAGGGGVGWAAGGAVAVPANKTLYARSCTGGGVCSPVVSWDFVNQTRSGGFGPP